MAPRDQWAALNYKLDDTTGINAYPGVWVPPREERRILAYEILDDLANNNAEQNLNTEGELDEYGLAGLLIRRIVAGLLGGKVTPTVDGAHQPPPDEPPLPTKPSDPGPTATPAETARHQALLARYETQVAANVEAWQEHIEAHDAAKHRQTWFDAWWDTELANLKLHNSETAAVKLGDTVKVYGWSTEKNRPTMRVYDPGAYFPDLSGDLHEYPGLVNLVWVELPETDDDPKLLHRIQYRLGPIEPAGFEDDGTPIPYSFRYDDDSTELVDRAVYEIDDQGASQFVGMERTTRWGETTRQTCFMEHRVWPEGDALDWKALDTETSSTVTTRRDIGVNFIPIEHVPNTPADAGHYGQSSLILITGLLERFAAACQELAEAAALASKPAVLTSGLTIEADTILEPGSISDIGDGKFTVLNLGPSLAPLIDVTNWLLDQIAVISEVGKPVLGITTGDAGSSGVKVRLEQGPFEQMINQLRMVREAKYSLGAKMVQRIAQYGGVLPAGPNPAVRFEFGPIIGFDLESTIADVTALRAANQISVETGLAMLILAGLPVGDVEREVRRIEMQNYQAAVYVADATGSEAAAARFLGINTDGDESAASSGAV